MLAALAIGWLAAVGLTGAGTVTERNAGTAPSGTHTSYGPPTRLCQFPDPRLGGVTARGDRVYLVTGGALSTLEPGCRLAKVARLPAGTAARDLAVAPDGALWIGELGGARRPVVVLHRWAGAGAERFVLRYPDGPQEADALLLSYAGQVVIVARSATGRSGVYAAQLPLRAESVLTRVAELDLRALRAPTDTAPGSLLVAGGAVAPDGTHFALRTDTAGYEWDTPDGDLVRELRRGKPRRVPLMAAPRGGIGYTGDGRRFLTAGSSAIHAVAISRTPVGPATPSSGSGGLPVLTGGVAVALLGAGIVVLGRQRRRAATTVTTYQSLG